MRALKSATGRTPGAGNGHVAAGDSRCGDRGRGGGVGGVQHAQSGSSPEAAPSTRRLRVCVGKHFALGSGVSVGVAFPVAGLDLEGGAAHGDAARCARKRTSGGKLTVASVGGIASAAEPGVRWRVRDCGATEPHFEHASAIRPLHGARPAVEHLGALSRRGVPMRVCGSARRGLAASRPRTGTAVREIDHKKAAVDGGWILRRPPRYDDWPLARARGDRAAS